MRINHDDDRNKTVPVQAGSSPRRMSVGAASHVGNVREENQDRISRFRCALGEILLVVDGMGGHQGGGVAAEMTVKGIERFLAAASPSEPAAETLQAAANAANHEVYRRAHSDDPATAKMGATGVFLLLQEDRALIAHAGDSRAYLLRDGALSQLTKDHTPIQRMLDRGMITEEEAKNHPDASVVTRAFGRSEEIELEVARPFTLRPGDRILLCSDGLCGYIDDRAIAEILSAGQGSQATAESLIELALEAGGEDNVSVQVLSFRVPAGAPTQAPAAALPPQAQPVPPQAQPVQHGGPPDDQLVPRSLAGWLVLAAIGLLLLVAGFALATALRSWLSAEGGERPGVEEPEKDPDALIKPRPDKPLPDAATQPSQPSYRENRSTSASEAPIDLAPDDQGLSEDGTAEEEIDSRAEPLGEGEDRDGPLGEEDSRGDPLGERERREQQPEDGRNPGNLAKLRVLLTQDRLELFRLDSGAARGEFGAGRLRRPAALEPGFVYHPGSSREEAQQVAEVLSLSTESLSGREFLIPEASLLMMLRGGRGNRVVTVFAPPSLEREAQRLEARLGFKRSRIGSLLSFSGDSWLIAVPTTPAR